MSCFIGAVAFAAVYCYVYSVIIAHTVFLFPMWTVYCVILAAAVALLFLVKEDTRRKVFCGIAVGTLAFVVLCVLFYTTNYWFAGSRPYHRDACVTGKAQRGGGRHDITTYNVSLEFTDNKEAFCLDDRNAFDQFRQGDTIRVYLVNGLYGIPIIKNLSLKK